jgi:hypothetical protein
MKRTAVRSAGTLVERFRLMEPHAGTGCGVEAADAVLDALGMGWADRWR